MYKDTAWNKHCSLFKHEIKEQKTRPRRSRRYSKAFKKSVVALKNYMTLRELSEKLEVNIHSIKVWGGLYTPGLKAVRKNVKNVKNAKNAKRAKAAAGTSKKTTAGGETKRAKRTLRSALTSCKVSVYSLKVAFESGAVAEMTVPSLQDLIKLAKSL